MVQALRPSLNRMVLDALQALQNSALVSGDNQREFLTAREVKDAIDSTYHISYPIQTIIVVLNRFASRGVVNRITFAGEEVRQRYGYYICQPEEERVEERIWGRFKAFADEFFHGDYQEAIEGANQLIVKRISAQPAKANKSSAGAGLASSYGKRSANM